MATITLDLFSEDGVANAIRKLDDWQRHTLDPAVDSFALLVTQEVSEAVAYNTHVYTGQLRSQASPGNIKGGNGHYQIVIDPVSPDKKTKQPVHYAQIERGRGGDHDFMDGFDEYAERAIKEWKEMFKAI